jgi:hypothetical protein
MVVTPLPKSADGLGGGMEEAFDAFPEAMTRIGPPNLQEWIAQLS